MQFRALGGIMIAWAALSVGGCHGHGGIVHRVESGESLSQLAHVYGVTLPELLSANPQLKSDELKAGEKILIPGATEDIRTTQAVWDMAELHASREEGTGEIEETPVNPKAAPSGTSPSIKKNENPSGNVASKGKTVSVPTQKGLSFGWPATGAVISKFGMRNRKMHNGIDIRVNPDANIVSTTEGKVAYVGNDVEGYGNLVIVHHPTNLFSVYAYVGEITAKKGQNVSRGTVIAKAKKNPQEAFFHFEVRKGKRALNPLQLLPR